MEFTERKKTILKAIIRTYLETGEPVGSRTISKYSDLHLSSATIRNEMADLEEMGYIIQPHTSAGRIPSDQGYRVYVDELMQEKDREVAQMQELMIQKTDRMEKVLKQVVKVLATNTNYATMITGPSIHHTKVKFIQLSKVHENQLLAVIVTEGNLVRNQMLPLDEPVDDEILLRLNLLLNTQLSGRTIDEITLALITRIKEEAGIHSGIVADVIDAVAQVISSEEDESPVYTSGATNIFRYPELSDSDRAVELIEAFEEKQVLRDMIQETMGETAENGEQTGIQVYIGGESPVTTMQDCSVVTASYDLGKGIKGTIGIIGPKRMDYENVMGSLKNLKGQLDRIFREQEDSPDK